MRRRKRGSSPYQVWPGCLRDAHVEQQLVKRKDAHAPKNSAMQMNAVRFMLLGQQVFSNEFLQEPERLCCKKLFCRRSRTNRHCNRSTTQLPILGFPE